MSGRNLVVKIIKEICKEQQIEIECFSDDWILKLNKKGKDQYRYIVGDKFELNLSSIDHLCIDKAATSDIMKSHKIPNVKHYFFENPEIKKECNKNTNYTKILELLNEHKKVVCKPNNGSGGRNVYLVKNEKELNLAINNIFEREDFLALSPFYEIKKEYRLIIVNEKIQLIYSKQIPYILGNGVNTISELAIAYLKKQEIDLAMEVLNNKKVLEKNEKYNLNWKHNLGQGAKAVILEDEELIRKLSELGNEVINKLNIKFASLDIVEIGNEYKVIEINSSVMMGGFASQSDTNYNMAKEIYKEALLKMFE